MFFMMFVLRCALLPGTENMRLKLIEGRLHSGGWAGASMWEASFRWGGGGVSSMRECLIQVSHGASAMSQGCVQAKGVGELNEEMPH